MARAIFQQDLAVGDSPSAMVLPDVVPDVAADSGGHRHEPVVPLIEGLSDRAGGDCRSYAIRGGVE